MVEHPWKTQGEGTGVNPWKRVEHPYRAQGEGKGGNPGRGWNAHGKHRERETEENLEQGDTPPENPGRGEKWKPVE